MAEITPQEIARNAVKLLTTRRLPPTPENFQAAYHEVAGTRALRPFPLENLRQIALALPEANPGQQRLKTQFGKAVRLHNWEGIEKALVAYVGQSALPGIPAPASPVVVEEQHAFPPELLEQMARIVDHALPAVGNDDTRLVEQAQELVNYLRLGSQHTPTLRGMMSDFAFRLSFIAEEQGSIRSLLLELLHTVFEHLSVISPDNPWLQTQMQALITASEPPLTARRLEDLQRQLRNVMHKQAEAKERTLDAQAAMKQTLSTFIERLGEITDNSGQYQQRVERCAEALEQATSLDDMTPILQEAIQATRSMAIDSQRVGDELRSLRDRSTQAEAEIQRLQTELDRLSTAASQDMLTGVLNRKGLEQVVANELSRSERTGSPMCLAVLDIDDFKKINDEYGHGVGDEALKHLAEVAQASLRSHDSIARYGGEEFVIVLPHTELEEGVNVITRLQRQLTTAYFMADDRQLLITFSAGVAQLRNDEDSAQTLTRADQAMYQAKRSGKNRVIGV
ncbi:MAG TPA: diguanylate cyclase [Macromonas sp.]|nr:diguanylate cyclase [Macromonas sp.]